MSEYIVQQFFKQESLLDVSLGTDGLLGYFASNYPTIIAMARSISDQENQTIERKQESYEELQDLRKDLAYLDGLINSFGSLSDSDETRYNEINQLIEFHEAELEREDPIFFRNEPLRMCPEYEFISKMEYSFPGIMAAMVEFDRLLRIPISNLTKRGLGWAMLPLKLVVGAILRRADLGLAGNLIYMLVDQYPDLIRQRMRAEEPSGRPADYPEHEVEGYKVKEIKNEVSVKYGSKKKK